MRRYGIMASFTVILLICIFKVSAYGQGNTATAEKYLNIATLEFMPISNDRLIYKAFKDIGYQTAFSTMPFETGCGMANNGEIDGVVASTPDMEISYPNLKKVPVPLEKINICAYVREGSDLEINSWNDLAGYRIGLNSQRPCLNSQLPQDIIMVERDNSDKVMEELAQGNCDVAVLSYYEHESFSLQNGVILSEILDESTVYLYLHKKYQTFIPSAESAIKNMFEDGRAKDILNDVPIFGLSGKKTILHIISSSEEVTREEHFSAKIREYFKNDMSLEWYTLSLNSRRFLNDTKRISFFANLLRQDCVSKDISAIIVSGDDAYKLVEDYYELFFRNIPVLFYGISNQNNEINNKNFTGIAEDLSAYETVELALELFPDTKTLYVINDYTKEGQQYRKIMEQQLSPYSNKLNIEYNENVACDELIGNLKGLPENSLVFVGSYFVDLNGMYYPLYEMKRLLEQECKVPVLALYSTDVEYDSIGGKCLDYGKYGEILAGMLERLLNGESISEIPMISDSENYSIWVFDKIMLDRFGIREKSLPQGAIVINKIPSIWESDPRFAIILILLFLAGIIISVFLIRYNKQKELLIKDAKIREVKERLERVINTAPVAFLMSVNGEIIEVNEYVKKNLGLKTGELATQLYTDLHQRENLIEQASQQDFVEGQIVEFNMPGGETHRFFSNVTTAEYEEKQAYILWAMDIEENEKKRDELRMARQSLQEILDTMPIPVRITDKESAAIVYVNNSCLNLFDCDSKGDILGKSIYEMAPAVQSDGTDSQNKIGKLLDSKETISMEIEYLTSKGKIIDAFINACSIEYKGRNSMLGIITDLAAEKEQKQMLLNAAEKEKEANLLKSRFLVNMSHEIRTPMNAIIGLTEIELHKKLSDNTKEIYKKINTSAKNLLEIINDILDLSKIVADKIELFLDEFELEEVLNSALLVASPRLEGKNVEFMLDASLDLPHYIVGDRTRLWQILKNFLDNAAKYTEEGRIILKVFSDKEHSDNETITILFIIEDTGIGIGEDQMRRLFEPYEQIYNEAQKRYSGTGLGMAISKQLCEIMGGRLQVESRIGEGTTIKMNIPFKRSLNRETGIQMIQSQDIAGLEVLVVDDDKLSLDIMYRLLKVSNVNCTMAKNGTEAMEIILKRRDMGQSFDLILLDYMMEGLNGLETARQIHLALSKAPKLLMVTAYQKFLLKSELEKCGIDNVIEKPFIPSHFINKIGNSLGFRNENDRSGEPLFTKYKDVNVLLCEDYRLNQEVAVGMFEQFGVQATIAENGKQGVEMLKSGLIFDLIFMDLQMPVMDGYEATRIIRADPRFDNIPIISLTADAMKEIVDKCLEIGMSDHVAKPVEFQSLQRVFQKWLPKNKRTEEVAIPVISNENEALNRFGGDKKLYERSLLEFTQLLPDEWPEFGEAVRNLEELLGSVHKIKGASGNLSEKDIYYSAIELESSLRGSAPDEASYTNFIKTCGIAKKRIEGQVKDSNGMSGVNLSLETGSAGELTDLLSRLKNALDNYNPKESSDIINILKKKEWPGMNNLNLQHLYELTQKYEFDAALDVLVSIMEVENE